MISILFENSINAQGIQESENKVINEQIWIDFYPHYYLNDKFEYYGDFGYRSMISNHAWKRIYVRPSVKYHLNKTWELQVGLGLFYNFHKNTSNKFEVRPWQGVQFMWPRFNILHFKHLARIEERFSYNVNDNWSSSTEFRFRYRLSGKVEFTDNWFVPFYGESFIPVFGEVEEAYSNKGRVGLGLGYKSRSDWQLSFIFNWQGSRAGIDENIAVSDYAYQIKVKKVWSKLFFK